MIRSEQTGLGLALLGHLALLALLSLKLTSDKAMPNITTPPMGVELIDEATLGEGLPSPAAVAGQTPDNRPAPAEAVPLPQGPTPEEQAAKVAQAKAAAEAAAATAKAQAEAQAAKAAQERALAAAKAAKTAKDAAVAKLAREKADAAAKAAQAKAEAARKAAQAQAAAQKAAADKAAKDKAARDAAAKANALKAAQAKAAADKAAAAKAAKDKAAKEAAARAAQQKAGKGGTGLKDLKLDGQGASAGQTPKAAGMSAGEATRAISISLGAAVGPRFKRCAPTGFDLDLIKTPVTLVINRDGSLANVEAGTQTGINDSNRAQAGRLKECAVKAVRAAAPFTFLPKDHYDQWKRYLLTLKAK